MKLPFDLDLPSFGFGFALVVGLAFIVFLVEWFGQFLGTPFRPQVVIQTTKKTPWQVMMGCASSFLMIAGLGLLASVALVMVLVDAQLAEVAWILLVAAVSFLTGAFTRNLMG